MTFSWLKSLFGRRRLPENVYHPGEMLIYTYWDGSRWVRADPVRLYKEIAKVGPELAVDIKVAHLPSKDADQAHTEMIDKLRQIFNVKPLEEGGLTQESLVDLFDHFLGWSEGVKKNLSPSLTSSTSADSEPSSVAAPAITSSSASGSTGGASSTAGPVPSPSGPG